MSASYLQHSRAGLHLHWFPVHKHFHHVAGSAHWSTHWNTKIRSEHETETSLSNWATELKLKGNYAWYTYTETWLHWPWHTHTDRTRAGGSQAALGGSGQSSADGRQSQHDAVRKQREREKAADMSILLWLIEVIVSALRDCWWVRTRYHHLLKWGDGCDCCRLQV